MVRSTAVVPGYVSKVPWDGRTMAFQGRRKRGIAAGRRPWKAIVRVLRHSLVALVTFVGACPIGCADEVDRRATHNVPDWATDAIFYQIFPERFRNGDPSNDPTRESLEFPDMVPADWAISPWTSDWYARSAWEKELGEHYYDDGVFHRRYGGDLQGVLEKLDYLERLGINVVYFNPVFYARSLHKYDGNTFHHVDPFFGPDPAGDLAAMAAETSDPATWRWTAGDRLFLKLIEEAHSRGIRIVLDGVFNHSGRDFFAFADLRERQKGSPYRDWYIVEQFDDPATPKNEFRYKGWWGVDTLPEFANTPDGNDLHPGPKKYIFDATARWMDPDGDGDPADGLDGWRLDVANEVPNKFWQDWNAHIRKINPQAYTSAEIWDDASNYLEDCGFSATMNYHGFAFPVKGFLIDGTLSASGFSKLLNKRRGNFRPRRRYALMNLIDSHDTDRVASMIKNGGRLPYRNPDRFDYDISERASPRHDTDYDVGKPNARERQIQRLVALFQMTYVGAPMVYYGTESGMWGGDDPCDRKPMAWPDLAYEPETTDPRGRSREPDPVGFDEELFEFYREAIGLRRVTPALRRGQFQVLEASDACQAIVFLRRLHDDVVIVVLNRGDKPFEATVPVGDGFRLVPRFAATGAKDDVEVKQTDGRSAVSVPALDGVVLQRVAAE